MDDQIMSENHRLHPRQEIKIEVELQFLEDEPVTAITRNVSQGGLFICLNNPDHYTMGEMVSVNFKDPLNDFADTYKDAIIVRHDEDGIAIAFIEIEDL
jgi:hypothetical protein